MKIDLQIDSARLVLRLRNGERRLAYAVVNAINNTAKRIRDAERRRVEEEFTVRKKAEQRASRGALNPARRAELVPDARLRRVVLAGARLAGRSGLNRVSAGPAQRHPRPKIQA